MRAEQRCAPKHTAMQGMFLAAMGSVGAGSSSPFRFGFRGWGPNGEPCSMAGVVGG
jgi:hypothetical protein